MVLKNDRLKEKEKKRSVESLLGSLADERYALLVNLGKKISDWGQDDKKDSKFQCSISLAGGRLTGRQPSLCAGHRC